MFLRVVRADGGETPSSGPIEFVAATPGTKRDGLDLASMPWRTDNYVRNPVVTWAHDLRGDRLPIGRAEVKIEKGDAGEVMRASIVFDEVDPFAAEVARKYRAGFLHAVSVTWDDVDAKGLTKRAGGGDPVAHELLEIAAVPVPGDQDALIERQRSALLRVSRAIAAALDGLDVADGDMIEAEVTETITETVIVEVEDDEEVTDDESDTIERAVGAMLAAMTRGDCDEADRRRTYNRAEAMYRRLGLDAPEYVTGEDLRVMDDETWRGLFLAGEVPGGERAGAVLNRRNVQRLQQAGRLIREVLDSAGSEIGKDDEGEEEGEGERARDVVPDWLLELARLGG